MKRRYTIFFDDGGVLNDNRLRAPEWQRLVGEFFVEKFGGTPKEWEEANKRLLKTHLVRINNYENVYDITYNEFWRREDLLWFDEMCEFVGISPKLSEKEKLEIVTKAINYITPRVSSAITGMSEVVLSLFNQGYKLYTASAEREVELKGYLSGMGIVDCFKKLYGPDLINIPKFDKNYYRLIFKREALKPENAIIIDDTPGRLDLAHDLGANVIHSCLVEKKDSEYDKFTKPEDLFLLINKIENSSDQN